MLSNYNIKMLKFSTLKPDTTIVIFGRRHTGKSTIIHYLLYKKSPVVRIPIVFSNTAYHSGEYDGRVPTILIHKKYSEKAVRQIFDYQNELMAKYEGRGKKRLEMLKNESIVVMDDVTSDEDLWKKNKSFKEVFYEGRHTRVSLIITVHDYVKLPSDLRSNIDYVIITGETRTKRIDNFRDDFWDDRFGDKKKFKHIFDWATAGWKALFIDVKKVTQKIAPFEECIKYVLVPEAERIPVKKCGLKSLWMMNHQLYNPNWKTYNTSRHSYLNQNQNKSNKRRRNDDKNTNIYINGKRITGY